MPVKEKHIIEEKMTDDIYIFEFLCDFFYFPIVVSLCYDNAVFLNFRKKFNQ